MMDVTPKISASEYIDIIKAEARRKRMRYTFDELIEMLVDLKRQVTEKNPQSLIIRKIDIAMDDVLRRASKARSEEKMQ